MGVVPDFLACCNHMVETGLGVTQPNSPWSTGVTRQKACNLQLVYQVILFKKGVRLGTCLAI